MQIFPFLPTSQDLDQTIEQCVTHLAQGKLLGIPTETVYGLAGDATNGIAVARIFEMKGRPQFNPLIAHVSGLQMAKRFGVFDEVSLKLAEHFWPGALTLVVPQVPDAATHSLVSAGLDTIALRCPGGLIGDLIECYDRPLAAPSANRSGKVSATNAAHVASEFQNEDIIILDGGACKVGLESTIAKVEAGSIRILRSGSVTAQQLSKVSGLPVEFAETGSEIEAPGMLKSHYAPRSKVKVNCIQAPENSALLGFGNQFPQSNAPASYRLDLSANGDLLEAASNLYDYLRQLDETGKEQICVSPVPNEGLGIAINDRLSRAAAPRPTETEL